MKKLLPIVMLLGMTPMAARADLVHRLSTSTQLTVDAAFTSGTRIGSTYTVSGTAKITFLIL